MIPVYQPFMFGREKEYVNECLDTTWISSRGTFITRFEDAFTKYLNAPHATTVCNGTVALHLAMAALGLKAGDEVIVPSLTYIASVNTVLQTGASVVFADSLCDSWNIDPEDVRKKITKKTKAVMAVHLYGLPCDMDALTAICKEHNLLLIEDCAEAFGTLYKGRHVGTFGDAGTFSFFGNKTITTGEGGMVVMRDPSMHEKAAHLKNQGVSKTREYWHDSLAYNYRMTNIQAAIGLAQIEQADGIIAKKRQLASWYREGLAGLPIIVQPELEGCFHTYWMCAAMTETAEDRNGVRSALKAAEIETRPLFPPAHTMPHCAADIDLPIALKLSACGMNLPSYPALTAEQVTYICDVIRTYYTNKK